MTGRRIVLGCGDPELAQRVVAVALELGHELITVAPSSSEAADAVSTHQPDVFIIAEDLSPVPVLDLIRQVSRHDPFVGILLLSQSEDPELYRVAMEAGARSIAPLGFNVDDLGQRIGTTADWAGLVRMHLTGGAGRSDGAGHVVVLAGGKGGVGTTTISVHVALEAAVTGRRACLVDLDLQTGDVAALLDITHRRDVADLIPVSDEITGQMLADVLYRHQTGLEVLLAPREGERGEEITEGVARMVLGALKSRFDVVVVDIGAVLTPAGAAAVQMADKCVLVGAPDVLSVRGARRAVRLWERLGLRRDSDVSLVLNRVSRHVEVQPELAGRLARLRVEEVLIPASFRALEAAGNTGDPSRVTDRDVRRALARTAQALGVRGVAGGAVSSRGGGGRRRSLLSDRSGRRSGRGAGVDAPPDPATPGNGTPGNGLPQNGLPQNVSPANGVPVVPVVPVVPFAGVGVPGANGAGTPASPAGRRDAGQTAVELMGLMPVILVLLVCLVQGVLIGYSHIAAGHSAEAAARVAVSPLRSVADIQNTARQALPTAWRPGAQVQLVGAGGAGGDPRWSDSDTQVRVTVRTPAFLPIAGRLFGGAMLASSSAQMRFEG